MLATITIQPHVKQRLSPQKLLPFSWDKVKQPQREVPTMTTAERHARAELMRKKLGGTI